MQTCTSVSINLSLYTHECIYIENDEFTWRPPFQHNISELVPVFFISKFETPLSRVRIEASIVLIYLVS